MHDASTTLQNQQQPTPHWSSTGLTLAQIAPAALQLPREAFAAVYGNAFFVRHAMAARPRLAPMRTELTLVEDDDPRERTGEIVLLVQPLLRGVQSTHPFVSIGRLEANDVCIADETLSKFHAYVRDVDGTLFLQDARSRNGTTVDGVNVAARGAGDAVALRPGNVVRFGSVTTSFLDVDGLVSLARRMSRSS